MRALRIGSGAVTLFVLGTLVFALAYAVISTAADYAPGFILERMSPLLHMLIPLFIASVLGGMAAAKATGLFVPPADRHLTFRIFAAVSVALAAITVGMMIHRASLQGLDGIISTLVMVISVHSIWKLGKSTRRPPATLGF